MPTVQIRTSSCIGLSLTPSSAASLASSALPPSDCCDRSAMLTEMTRPEVLSTMGWPVSSRISPRTDGSTTSLTRSSVASATYRACDVTCRYHMRGSPARAAAPRLRRRAQPGGAWTPGSSQTSRSLAGDLPDAGPPAAPAGPEGQAAETEPGMFPGRELTAAQRPRAETRQPPGPAGHARPVSERPASGLPSTPSPRRPLASRSRGDRALTAADRAEGLLVENAARPALPPRAVRLGLPGCARNFG